MEYSAREATGTAPCAHYLILVRPAWVPYRTSGPGQHAHTRLINEKRVDPSRTSLGLEKYTGGEFLTISHTKYESGGTRPNQSSTVSPTADPRSGGA